MTLKWPDKLRSPRGGFNTALRLLRAAAAVPHTGGLTNVPGSRDPRVGVYIEESAEFARPILNRLREIVHAACPDVLETIKWNAPHFDYRGPLCGMAAFQEHCAFGFWKGSLIIEDPSDEAMGQLGRISRLGDLPPKKTLTSWVRKAMKLNDEGVKVPRATPAKKRAVRVPADLRKALGKNARARSTFEGFSPSHRREYVEWIEEAKRPETRARRLAAVEWMSAGKSRHWRYRLDGRAALAWRRG